MPLPNDFQNSSNKEMYVNYEKQIVSESWNVETYFVKIEI